ncbi:IclR family transcriptional regulator C-terminal domain-containing protein [Streptomyces sp. P9(2023)]|uniref:IclR family transcriptional regulator domain-containing protein n=1 Tax=Streptomyces sp. P9(2023) TaxID=3064394 RepID=UPI0028F4489B|nr:IclR family transcriptional regulator C-terminal domain-containing protein [Streptomyces sp. P9(2023)]MDT9687195.1 IclR family transcriptional regulator C-terminal domain-containing protein [Streptomyces sp. P9(2023)]
MTVVSRFNEVSGGRPAPDVPAGLVELMNRLAGPPDFWDRPDGEFGPLAESYETGREERERANSLYRLGSKALGRDELASAAQWLGEAAAVGHPGALFRLAVVALRAGGQWADDASYLVAEAARHGHGDAGRLLSALGNRRPADGTATPRCEDPEFFEEVRTRLGVPEHLLDARTEPQATPEVPEEPTVDRGGGELDEQPQLFLVRAPQVPSEYRHAPEDGAGAASSRPRLTALPGGQESGLVLPIPLLPADAPTPSTPLPGRRGEEPWWSANALRPAILNNMARRQLSPAVIPARWQATQRARDLLHLIMGAGGTDTRTLAQRGGMSLNGTALLLEWLRAQGLVVTVVGVHHPGPVLDLVTRPDPDRLLLKNTLAGLRDELDAAVYLSSYTDGEIRIHEAAHSPTAPPVDEWAPFTDTGHASAVGKSLLAQLDFDSRMDHLTRYPSIQLTDRTITNPRALIETLDGQGPHAAQFDLLEYSRTEVCVAYSLGLPGRATSVALSLPAYRHPRLIAAAHSLSRRATGLLLAQLLTDDHHPAADTTTPWTDTTPEPRRALP